MAENMNYIGVAMGLDVTDLKAGLSEANKQIQLANSEFRAASSGMDDWTKSTEGLTAKVRQLDTVLNAQKSKLAGLQAEYDKVAAEQGENSEAARKLKVQINNQQTVVNKTQREFDNYSETLKQAKKGTIDLDKVTVGANGKIKDLGESANEAGKNLDGIKGVAKGVVGGIAAIGAAAVGAVASFLALAESTQEYREDQARLEAAFEASGKSAESASKTYTQLFRAMGESDTAVEASQQIALLAKSEQEAAKWAEQATNVVGTFGDALKPEVFYESANETLKLGEATGSWVQMIEGTGGSVEEFNAGLAACSTEAEKNAYMLAYAEKQMGQAGTAYEESAGSILDAREASANLTDALANLGAVAEPIMSSLKQLAADLLTEMTPFITVIGEGLAGVLNGTDGAADTLAQGLGGLLSSLLEKIVSALPVVLETIVSLISTLLPQVISTLTNFLPQLITTLSAQLPVILQALIAGFSQILSSIGDMLPELIPIIIDAVLMIVDTLLDNIDQLIDAGIELLLGLADGLIAALPRLLDKIPVIIDKLMGALSRNAPKLIQAGIELLVKLAAGLIQAIPQLVSKIPQIITSIVKGFSETQSEMDGVGLNLLKGIWNGIKDGAKWLKDKITGFAGNVAGWFKDTFKINSPSKLMADEVGSYIGEGIGVGVLDSIPTVKKQLGKFAGFVQDNLGGIKSGLAINGGAGVGGGSTVVNAGMTVNYNGKLSRKQLKQIEQDNYTTVKMRLSREGAIA